MADCQTTLRANRFMGYISMWMIYRLKTINTMKGHFMKTVEILAGVVIGLTPTLCISQTRQICDSQPVPAGNVIVERSSTNQCPGVNGTYRNATLTVRSPVSPLNICSESPFPAGYIIASHLTNNECWNLATMQHTRATWTIRHPVSPDKICTNSPIPSGYVIKQSLNSSQCFNPGGTTAASSYDIKIPDNEEAVCSFSPIPSGYTVIRLVGIPNCTDSGGGPGGQGMVIKKF
jgi:hypothetical protein